MSKIDLSSGLDAALTALVAGLTETLDDATEEGVHRNVIEFYNDMMEIALVHQDSSVKLAESAVAFFSERALNWPLCLFLELLARCLFNAGRVHDGCLQLERLAYNVRSDDRRASLIELAGEASQIANEYSADVSPIILASLTRVYTALYESQLLVETFLQAASIYSSHGAQKAAYSCLEDAETIGRAENSLTLLAKVYAETAVAAYELQDFASSIAAGNRCLGSHPYGCNDHLVAGKCAKF
ncbi:hypothetical protein [Bradyrhizobium ivorense]|uniref:hypothetical protein n=1 Tax=Bradyrhizobium ivorense TaxID=2511166 RepID=UPI00111DAB86|nr:hypothetical protein [Bradyrhizobium ivorense]